MTTVSDFLLERLSAWGVRRIYGYPGDGINGMHGRASTAPATSCEFIQARHEEMAAFMACAPRQVHRRGRRLPGDLGPGRDPPAQRPLRRQARPPAGGRDRRPAGARRARRRLPAGGRPADACSRTSRTSTCRWPRRRRRCGTWSTARCASRSTERTVTCIIVPNDVQELDAVETPPHEHGTVHSGVGYTRAARRARPTTTCARAAEVLNAGEQGRDPGRRRRAATPTDEVDRGRRAARRRRRQGAARQGGRCPTTCPSSPARSACSARSRAGS